MLPNPLHEKQTGLMIPNLHHTRTFSSSMTLEDSDRTLIVETLEQAGWIVGGPRGAAAKLALKRTTLLAKMRRLGISRPIDQEGTDARGAAGEDAQIESVRGVSLWSRMRRSWVTANDGRGAIFHSTLPTVRRSFTRPTVMMNKWLFMW